MRILLCLLALAPIMVNAQNEGIRFENNLAWDLIKQKAKLEGKYIFVDCFATWCGPCKEMDSQVYTDGKVVDYMNKNFISVKIQMDTTTSDGPQVKAWYKDALQIKTEYELNAYPSFLFFDPDGKIVHKGIAFKNPDDFLLLASDARIPKKQYYTLLENYHRGRKDYEDMAYLAETAESLGEVVIAKPIAKEYIDNYLLKLKDSDLYRENNIRFIAQFIGSKDKGFNLFYHEGRKIDAVMGKDAAEEMVDYIIAKEDVDPILWRNNKPIQENPDWNAITAMINKKYKGNYAVRTILDAQIRWYNSLKDWKNLAKYNLERLDKFGMDTSGMGKFLLDNMIWEVIFLHIEDKSVIEKGIYWMETILRSTNPNNPADLDTYANLLYKLGKTDEAYSWEEKAVRLEEENGIRNKMAPDKVFQETLAKMKKGLPTWIAN